MKKFLISFALTILCLCFIITPIFATYIEINDTYCSVQYQSDKKLKVGIKYANNKTIYYDYISNKTFNYAFENGNGDYIIALYEQKKDNVYKIIEQQKVSIENENEIAPFLISTYDIQFSINGIISKTAKKLCKNCDNDWSKIIIIKDYVDERIKYDSDLAQQITNKTITTYVPNALNVWLTKKGICYDIASLFAAMCRSQGIPCTIKKGYVNKIYHAWNEVYVDGTWYFIDVK